MEKLVLNGLKAALRLLDKDGNGKITKDDLSAVLGKLISHDDSPCTKEAFREAIAEADLDRDGNLDVDEFCNWVCAELRMKTDQTLL